MQIANGESKFSTLDSSAYLSIKSDPDCITADMIEKTDSLELTLKTRLPILEYNLLLRTQELVASPLF